MLPSTGKSASSSAQIPEIAIDNLFCDWGDRATNNPNPMPAHSTITLLSVPMLRHLISKALTQTQIDLKQHIALLLDDFRSIKLNLPSLAAMGFYNYCQAASSPRVSSGASHQRVTLTLSAIFSSRIQATLVPYQPKESTRLKRSC